MKKSLNVFTDHSNKVVNEIKKININKGDILIFHIATDDCGVPMCPLEVVQQTANMIGDILEDKDATGIFMMDKICLFSVENSKEAIESLENCASYIQEAIDKVRDIENGKICAEDAVIQFKDAAGPV